MQCAPQYDKSEEEAVNGFVAGLAGSALRDEPDFHIASKKRTIRLSANSGSYEVYIYTACWYFNHNRHVSLLHA